MAAPQLVDRADTFYTGQAELARDAADAAQDAWQGVDAADLTASWTVDVAPRVLDIVALGQRAAATRAAAYLVGAARLAAGNGQAGEQVDPEGYVLSPALVETVTYRTVVNTRLALVGGKTLPDALATGAATLTSDVATLVADAGREATGAGIVGHPHMTGYYRQVTAPACPRCVILAGRHYRWNAGFARHPRCDCVHVPVTEADDDLAFDPRGHFDSLTRPEQDRRFGTADAQAIRDGADMSRVVNARAGVRPANLYGRTAEVTTRGARAVARQSVRAGRYHRPDTARLSTTQIFRDARSREDAVRLLRRHGYLI